MGHGVADVGRAVDAYRTRGHLGYGHDVGELLRGEPLMYGHYLVLNQGQHRIPSPECERSYYKEGAEELKEYHFSASFL